MPAAITDSLSFGLSSVQVALSKASSALTNTTPQMPDARLNQLEGVSACVQMQPQLDYVQTNARPTIGAPKTPAMQMPSLNIPNITDMGSRTYQVPDAPHMPNVQQPSAMQSAGAIGSITSSICGARALLAGVMPTLNLIASVGNTLKGLSNSKSLLGSINLLAFSDLGRITNSVFASGGNLNPIAVAASLAGKAQQVNSSLSMLKSGNLNSASSLYAAANVLNSASSLVPSLGLSSVGQQVASAASTVSSLTYAVNSAASSTQNAISSIGSAMANPTASTPMLIANSTASALNTVSYSMSTLGEFTA